jgi:acyl-CoA synthetase (NDP forming)
LEKLGNPALLEQIQKLVDEGVQQFCGLPRKYGKPIACVRWHGDVSKDPVSIKLIEAGIPVYDTPEQCARAMHGLVTYADLRRRYL